MSGYEEMRMQMQMEGNDDSVVMDVRYTAYSISSRGYEEIECYGTVEEAVYDMLEMWPEDDDGDVMIEDDTGLVVVYFARSDADPRIVHVYSLSFVRSGAQGIESYRCEYTTAFGGSVRTVIKRLA